MVDTDNKVLCRVWDSQYYIKHAASLKKKDTKKLNTHGQANPSEADNGSLHRAQPTYRPRSRSRSVEPTPTAQSGPSVDQLPRSQSPTPRSLSPLPSRDQLKAADVRKAQKHARSPYSSHSPSPEPSHKRPRGPDTTRSHGHQYPSNSHSFRHRHEVLILSDDDRTPDPRLQASQVAGSSHKEKVTRPTSSMLEEDPAVVAAMQQLERARRAAAKRASEQALEDEERELQERLDRLKRKRANIGGRSLR